MRKLSYVGLLRVDGTEPPEEAGYVRVQAVGPVCSGQHVFPQVQAPGYGLIDSIAAFEAPEGGAPAAVYPLPELVDVHEGVVPLVYEGKLLRGMEVQARAVLRSADLCRTGGDRP